MPDNTFSITATYLTTAVCIVEHRSPSIGVEGHGCQENSACAIIRECASIGIRT